MNVSVRPRFLTKSRFKLALECPTKLFYTGKPDHYIDTSEEDDFLKALAEGGFQVGELAKIMFPGGHDIKALDPAQAVEETNELLQRDDVTIYEAAIRNGDLFIRVDVLTKQGETVELIEVKAKSFRSTDPAPFTNANGSIKSDMLPYLQDVAFQTHVIRQAYPQWQVSSFLMLADKSATASVDGLNQRFKIHRDARGRSHVRVLPGTTADTIGSPILASVNVDEHVSRILQSVYANGAGPTLAVVAQDWGDAYRLDRKIPPEIGSKCAKCEFRAAPGSGGLRSGYHECWQDARGLSPLEVDQGTVLDLYNFRRKQELIDHGTFTLRQVSRDDLKLKEDEDGISTSHRQWMQASGTWPGGEGYFLDRAVVAAEMTTWTYPLHFIDFETARVAVPFFASQRPYDNIAFQFSHHEVQRDGTVAHKHQFLSTAPGRRPNYEFVRQLKAAVGNTGTVFMWTPHENTTLNAILAELEDDPYPPADADAIRNVILELTRQTGDNKKMHHSGSRAMVDLCNLAKRAFFHPATAGSSSIKKVLPAVMRASPYLVQRYSQPIYGAPGGIASLNFTNQVWWQATADGVENPYKLLLPVFLDIPPHLLECLESGDDMEIAEGGAATTAYARLQFDDVPPLERTAIEAAMLRYCELDTLAMVLIYEAWREWAR